VSDERADVHAVRFRSERLPSGQWKHVAVRFEVKRYPITRRPSR